jgi:hypothetical protein
MGSLSQPYHRPELSPAVASGCLFDRNHAPLQNPPFVGATHGESWDWRPIHPTSEVCAQVSEFRLGGVLRVGNEHSQSVEILQNCPRY